MQESMQESSMEIGRMYARKAAIILPRKYKKSTQDLGQKDARKVAKKQAKADT